MKTKFLIVLTAISGAAYSQCTVTANAPMTICTGDEVTLTANAANGTAPYTYFWIPSFLVSNPNAQSTTASPVTTTTFSVTITDASGCTATTTATVFVNTIPYATFCPFSVSGNTVSFCSNVSSNTISCYWIFGDGNNATTYPPNQDPTHTYTSAGNYTVCLIAFNPPCSDTLCQSTAVSVEDYQFSSSVKIFPNPNNGIFSLTSNNKISSIEIFSVLGEKIYSAKINSAKAEIDLSKQQGGIYFVLVISEQGTVVKKIIFSK